MHNIIRIYNFLYLKFKLTIFIFFLIIEISSNGTILLKKIRLIEKKER